MHYPSEFVVFDMWIAAKKTNIQIIVTRHIGERDGLDYTKELLSTFDLDFCRMAIYCQDYVKVQGGKNTLLIFMDDKHRREMGRPRNNSYSQKTLIRSRKYVSRLNYNHFCQFTIPLEDMSVDMYDDIILDHDINQSVSHVQIINEE